MDEEKVEKYVFVSQHLLLLFISAFVTWCENDNAMVKRTVNIQTVIEAEDFFTFSFLPKAL